MVNIRIRSYLKNNEMLAPRIIEAAGEGETNFDEYIATLEGFTLKIAEGVIGGFIVEKAADSISSVQSNGEKKP